LENIVPKSSLNPECPAFVPSNDPAIETNVDIPSNESQINLDDMLDIDVDDNDVVDDNHDDEYIDDTLVDEVEQPSDDVANNSINELSVYLTCLEPEEVMILPVTLCGVPLRAMIDTGANTNLIREDIVSALNLPVDVLQTAKIKGLGGSEIVTKGTVDINLTVLDKKLTTATCNVMSCHDRKYDIILGERYLWENKFVINVKRRRVSFRNADESGSDFYLDRDGNALTSVHEKIPVLAAEYLFLGKEARPLRVNFCVGG